MHAIRRESGGALKIAGTIDLSATEALRTFLSEYFAREEHVELDLSEVSTCDTAGMQLLYAAYKTAARLGKPFRFVALSPAIADTGSALGLTVEQLTGGVSVL